MATRKNQRNVLSVELWTDVIDVTPPGAQYRQSQPGDQHAALMVPIPIWLGYFILMTYLRIRQVLTW